jgi:hypothetical protein
MTAGQAPHGEPAFETSRWTERGVEPELAFRLLRRVWGHGCATESVRYEEWGPWVR